MIKRLTLKNLKAISILEKEYGFLSLEQLNNNIQSLNHICLGWFEGKTLGGYLIASRVIESIDIIHVFVAPAFRRQQIATNLINELIKDSHDSQIHIEVSSNNNVAIEMYKKIGFKQINIRKNYYGLNKDAICMVLK